MNYILVLFACIFVNNVIFTQVYGTCPFLGVSKKTDQAIGMGLAVTFVMLAATAVTWPIQYYLLNRFDLAYLQTLTFILVIATLVQFIEMVLKKYIPALHASLGVYLPLITTNCAVLGVTVDNISADYSFLTALITAVGSGLGFLLAMLLFAIVRGRIEKNNVTKSWDGLPLTLAAAAIVSVCFRGFDGVMSVPTAAEAPELYHGGETSSYTAGALQDILLAVLVVTVVGVVCAGLLMLAARYMTVKEDERFPKVRALLPGANCGACGYPGCDGYAQALLSGDVPVNKCIPGADDVASALADFLGKDFEDVVEQVAIIRCEGDCNVTKVKCDYHGIETCAAAKLQYGSQKACSWGCIGFGDCVKVCPQNAICIVDGIARVDSRACIGCGLCASKCPQSLIEMISDKERNFVICNNRDSGAVTRQACSVGCIGCKKCEKVCPSGAIKVENNLARINQSLCVDCGKCVENCPVGAIANRDISGWHRQKR